MPSGPGSRGAVARAQSSPHGLSLQLFLTAPPHGPSWQRRHVFPTRGFAGRQDAGCPCAPVPRMGVQPGPQRLFPHVPLDEVRSRLTDQQHQVPRPARQEPINTSSVFHNQPTGWKVGFCNTVYIWVCCITHQTCFPLRL